MSGSRSGRSTGLRQWLTILPAVVLAAGCATGATDTATTGLGQRLLQAYIRPSTSALHAATSQLHANLRAYCNAPGDSALRTRVEAALGSTTEAWARVELLRFGPLVEANRLENFFFWPDPRGVVQRQVRALLARVDPAVLEPASLRQQSAAVQGLPGLEYALFADEGARVIALADAAGRHRCGYASAVATNLQRLAAEIEAGWQAHAPLAVELAQPGPHRSVYRGTGEVATEALKALSTALHAARDQKLLPALGASAAEARGTLLPLHRSGLTARYLSAYLQAALDFHEAGRIGTALPPSEQWIDANLRAELVRIREDFQALTLPAAQAVADADQRDLLVHATLLLANARAILDEYLAPALGVNLGFNSLDGD